MEFAKMSKGTTYNLKVTKITENVKSINTRSGTRYRHDIEGIDTGTGFKYKCEYLTRETTQDQFALHCYSKVRCISDYAEGDTIEPCTLEVCDSPASRDRKLPAFHGDDPAPSAKSVNVSGLSTTFAHAYAKDILVAEMSRWHPARAVTPEDIARMNLNAEMINASIVSSIIF